MAKRQALGRGLASLFNEEDVLETAGTTGPEVQDVDITRVDPGPFQPRTSFDDERLEELAASIRSQGLLQPLVVRPMGDRFQVICGERRLRAARKAGLDDVPVVVRHTTDAEALELALVENIQRDDLDPIDLAEGFRRLQKEFGYTQEEVAQRVGKDRATVANHLRLLKLPRHAKEALHKGHISMGHARALLALSEPLLSEVLDLVLKKKLSVRETEQVVRNVARRGAVKPVRHAESEPLDEDIALQDMVQRIQRRLQTKVHLRKAKNGGGEIRIRYYSREELIRILELMPVE